MTTDEPPIMPTADEAEGDRVDPPGIVKVDYWLWLVAGAIGLAGALAVLVNKATLAEGYARAQGIALADATGIVQGLANWLIVGSAVFLILYWLLAHQMRTGVRKARALLLVVGVLSALFQYAFALLIFGPLCAVLTILAMALLYFPASRRFFDAHGR